MTKQEWQNDVFAGIQEDAKVKCWSILTETDGAYHIAIGESASGAEMLQFVAETLKHAGSAMEKTPIQVAKVAMALEEAKIAFEEETEQEADDDDQ